MALTPTAPQEADSANVSREFLYDLQTVPEQGHESGGQALDPYDIPRFLDELRVMATRLLEREPTPSLWPDDLVNTVWRRLAKAKATFKNHDELLAAAHKRMVWALRNRHRSRAGHAKHLR